VEGLNTRNAIASFLGRFSPFTELHADDLARVAAVASVERYRAGQDVLVEDAEPARSFYVIYEGSMELLHEEEVIDILEPGESFGHPSLLTGMAPAFTVRAHEDAACILIPREQALEVLGRPSGAGFVATTLRERLTRTGHAVHALPSLSTVRVGELLGREPVYCDPNTTITKAAEVMTEAGVSAALVRDGRRLFVLTDAQLRANVLAGHLSPENPVSRATVPAVEVDSDRLAVDAVVDMLDAGVDHLVVLDARRNVLGLLSATDLLGLESRSPFALRHAVLRARDEDDLLNAAERLRELFLALLDAGLSAADVGRVLSLQVDTFTVRLIDFFIRENGPSPVPWAWLDLGSAARREFTLASDQDNALAYADTGDDVSVDLYFERMGRYVNSGLARLGFGPDTNDVLAGNRLWRMSESAWLRVFEDCLESPDRSHLIRATVAFDFRHVAGGLEIVQPLVGIVRRARSHPDFVGRLARTATDFKPPLGFRGSLVLEREGKDGGRLDLKRGGVIPAVNLARFFAVSNGITISPTLDRLVAAEETGALDADTGAVLREAFVVFARARFQHHAAQIEAGQTPDNLIDPTELPPLARTELREAFRAIAQAQKRLSVYVPLGL
jgi:CBS domain-containing protein